jgi:hypothetical protein
MTCPATLITGLLPGRSQPRLQTAPDAEFLFNSFWTQHLRRGVIVCLYSASHQSKISHDLLFSVAAKR